MLALARSLALAVLLAAAPAAGQDPASAAPPHPPGGPGKSSLSADEIDGLLAGDGMGVAQTAERNHYPGPRHLLDVADEVGLSPEQRAAVRQIYVETIDRARAVGRQIVDREQALSDAFARGEITEDGLRARVAGIADLRGQLRVIHLTAHLKTRTLLSAAQLEKYEKLRGHT